MTSIIHDFDIILSGGNVIDGSGKQPFSADVGIKEDTLVAITDLSKASAKQKIDCANLCVCPGFIDVHSHSDTYILLRPDAPSKIHQGVTTEIVGQCGSSASPLCGRAKLPSDWSAYDYAAQWTNISEYLSAVKSVDPAVNIIPMTGHRNLRTAVMGMDAKPSSRGEIDQMKRLLRYELDNGSRGLTTGLLYQPALHATPDEINALVSECSSDKHIYATHLRSESKNLIPAIDEAIETAKKTNVQLQISHFKTSGKENWNLLDVAIEHIEKARQSGININADRYPYTAAGTDLDIILPEWAERGENAEILTRLKDSKIRKKIVAEMMCERETDYWETVMVGGTVSTDNLKYRGRFISDIANEMRCLPAEAVLKIVEADKLHTGGFFFGMSEKNLDTILSLPWVMVGSDSSIRAPTGLLSEDHPHPRAYGTFPKFLSRCIDKSLMSLHSAIRRITSLPAETFNISRRGILKPNHIADITIINPAQLKDNATFRDPHKYPDGITHVITSGKLRF